MVRVGGARRPCHRKGQRRTAGRGAGGGGGPWLKGVRFLDDGTGNQAPICQYVFLYRRAEGQARSPKGAHMAIRNVVSTLHDDGTEVMGPGILMYHYPHNDILTGSLLTVENN